MKKSPGIGPSPNAFSCLSPVSAAQRPTKRRAADIEGLRHDLPPKRLQVIGALPRTRSPSPGATASAQPAPAADALPHVDLVPATLTFSPSVPQWFKAPLVAVSQGLPWFPESMSTIHFDAFDATDRMTQGHTGVLNFRSRRPADRKVVITTAVDPAGEHDPAKLARDLYTAGHEMIDHGLPICESLSKDWHPLPHEVQHLKIFWPPDEGNAYHTAIKSVLKQVPRELRVDFLKEYSDDVHNHVEFDFSGGPGDASGKHFARGNEPMRRAGFAWADRLLRESSNPDGEFWTRDQIRDETDVDQFPPLGGNPMSITANDVAQSLAIEAARSAGASG